MPFPTFVVDGTNVVVVVGGRVEVDLEVIVVEVEVVVDDFVDETVGAGSPKTSTQYDFPTSTAQVVGREGFCWTG
jgi:hypothetical protein